MLLIHNYSVISSPIKFYLSGTMNPTLKKQIEVGIMNNNTDDLNTKLNREFDNQYFYGLQYILEDLFTDALIQPKASLSNDWYGLTDLTIE